MFILPSSFTQRRMFDLWNYKLPFFFVVSLLFLQIEKITTEQHQDSVKFVPCPKDIEENVFTGVSRCVEVHHFLRDQKRYYRTDFQDVSKFIASKKPTSSSLTPNVQYRKPITESSVYTFLDKISEAMLNYNLSLFDSTLLELQSQYKNNKTALSFLLNQPLNFTNGYGLMHFAAQSRGSYGLHFVQTLHHYGVDWNRLGPENITCLSLAVKSRNLWVVRWLLPLSVQSYNVRMGNKGENVLFTAIEYFHESIVHELLNVGMSTISLNAEKATPFYIAIQQRNVRAINLLLKYDVLHMQRDIYGKTIMDYAIETKNYRLVERLVFHKDYSRHVVQSRMVNHQDNSAIVRISRLLSHVSASTLKRLIEIETQRMNMAICVRGAQGKTLLWKIAYFLLLLQDSKRTPENRKIFSEIFHVLLNFYTYVRVTRYPMYKLCNPHATGYLESSSLTENRSYGRIPMDFFLMPSHFLREDTALISRFYIAMDPANENSLLARLARHNFNVYSLVNVINNKPQELSMRAFLLGRSGHLDGCSVATSRKLWVAARTCANVLKRCLSLPSGLMDTSNSSSHQGQPTAWTFNESSKLKYKMLHETCDVSFRRMILQSMSSDELVVVSRLFSNDVEYAAKILSGSPIRADRHVKRNLYLINLFISKNKTFPPSGRNKSPIENLFLSYLSYKAAERSLSDHRYLKALVNSPYIGLSRPDDIEKALNILGEATIYGFVKNYPLGWDLTGSLMKLPSSWSSLLFLLRHPLTRFGSNFVFTYTRTTNSSLEKQLRRPALILQNNLSNKTYTNAEEAQWALSLLGRKNSYEMMPSSSDSERPSDTILNRLLKRRREMAKILALSPSVRYDPNLRVTHQTALLVLIYLYCIRLIVYCFMALIVSKKIFGEGIARYVASSSVDFWQVVYPPNRGNKALFFGLSCGFFGRLGSRHHPHGFITTFMNIIQLILSVLSVVVLYSWALWTGDWLFVQCVVVLQVIVVLLAWLSTSSMSDRACLLLIASLCPCGIEDLEAAVFLSRMELLDWYYNKSVGISNEDELNAVISHQVHSMRMSRSSQFKGSSDKSGSFFNFVSRYPFTKKFKDEEKEFSENVYNDINDIWKTTSDINVGDVIQAHQELAGYAKFFSFGNRDASTVAQPFPHYLNAVADNDETPQTGSSTAKRWCKFRTVSEFSQSLRMSSYPATTKCTSIFSPYRIKHMSGSEENSLRLCNHNTDDFKRSARKASLTTRLSSVSQKKKQLGLSLRKLGITAYEIDPQRNQGLSCRVVPPEFLHNKTNKIYLGHVRAPQVSVIELQDKKIDPHLQWLNGTSEGTDAGNFQDQLIFSADMLRTQRQQTFLFNESLIDMGHLSYQELVQLATYVNTLDYLVLLQCYPELRRFTTKVFFAGVCRYLDYILVIILFETISFLCSIAPLVICIYAPREYQFAFRELYRNSFDFIVSKRIPFFAVLLVICRCNVYNRLLTEIIRTAALHMILSRQTYHIGNIFRWQALQCYLVFDPEGMMTKIWNIRRVACRKLDNMIELTSHQFNFLVFGLLGNLDELKYLAPYSLSLCVAAYPLFCFLLISRSDTFLYINLLLHVYSLLVAVALCIIATTLFGFLGYRALHEFSKLSDWIHRTVHPMRCSRNSLIFLADKNQMDPALNFRCLTISGFCFTSKVVLVVLILFLAPLLILGLMLFKRAFLMESPDSSVVM